jgi:dynein heavy chain
MLVFCLVWSFGISLKTESRVRFEEILRRINGGRGLPSTNLFENFYDFNKTKVWIPWEKMVLNYQPPEDGKFSKILVPTVDTTRFSYMLDQFIQSEQPLIFAGDSGTAKSVII